MDANFKTWGQVTWRATGMTYTKPLPAVYRGGLHAASIGPAGDPKDWKTITNLAEVPENEGSPVRYLYDGVGQPVRCKIDPPIDEGDGTVPAVAGAMGVKRAKPKVTYQTSGHDHQGSYLNTTVRHFVLDAIVRALAKAKIPA